MTHQCAHSTIPNRYGMGVHCYSRQCWYSRSHHLNVFNQPLVICMGVHCYNRCHMNLFTQPFLIGMGVHWVYCSNVWMYCSNDFDVLFHCVLSIVLLSLKYCFFLFSINKMNLYFKLFYCLLYTSSQGGKWYQPIRFIPSWSPMRFISIW